LTLNDTPRFRFLNITQHETKGGKMKAFAFNKSVAAAFGWGVLATIGMSVIMIIGKVTGMAPMPKPIPLAIVTQILGEGTLKPLLMGLAIIFHLGYGGFWGAFLFSVTDSVTIMKGFVLGVALWLIMQLVVLPFLGWGVFGMDITPKIAIATLVLHLLYGGILGWGLSRVKTNEGRKP
jgi:hypothetical protein